MRSHGLGARLVLETDIMISVFLVTPTASGCRKKIGEPNTAFSRCLTGRDVAGPLQGKCAEMGIISKKIT